MLLFKDILTNDEMFSDAFPFKEVGNIVYEVECKMVTIREGAVNIGANPSAEEGEEALEDGARTVNNVVESFRLKETGFNKKSYGVYIKEYMKAISAHLKENKPDELAEFQQNAQSYVKKIIAGIVKDEYNFYTGESLNPKGMVALLNYREDGITPYLIFWKHGLIEEKL